MRKNPAEANEPLRRQQFPRVLLRGGCNTGQAKAYLSLNNVPLVFTALHALEVRNALRLGVFRDLFSAADATAAWTNLQSDLKGGRLVKTVVKWPVAFRVAAGLSEQHSATTGTRSLDVLHVAAARVLRTAEFITFDARQRALAAALSMKVAP